MDYYEGGAYAIMLKMSRREQRAAAHRRPSAGYPKAPNVFHGGCRLASTAMALRYAKGVSGMR